MSADRIYFDNVRGIDPKLLLNPRGTAKRTQCDPGGATFALEPIRLRAKLREPSESTARLPYGVGLRISAAAYSLKRCPFPSRSVPVGRDDRLWRRRVLTCEYLIAPGEFGKAIIGVKGK